MKVTFVLIALTAALSVSAAAPATNVLDVTKRKITREEYDKLSPAEKKVLHEAALERRYRRTGGSVVKPGSVNGQLVYVNCQKRADGAWLRESVAYFRSETKFDVVLRDGSFDLAAPKVQGSASLFVVDDPALPAVLLAPQDRWAMVNVAPLAKDAKPAFFEARVKKQLTRGFALLCGASNSQFPMCLTGGVPNVPELDHYVNYRLPVDVLARFAPYLKPFGVTPAQVSTYRRGCEEGWAAQPTNDVQKAIWDEVHALPAKPMKIKYAPNKAK